MGVPQPSYQPFREQKTLPLIPLESAENLGAGPANELIAKLALAIAQEEQEEANASLTELRWPPVKTLALLFLGCGLFWALSVTALAALF